MQKLQIPEQFKTDVVDALENLYDIPHLQKHSLNKHLKDLNSTDANQAGNPLRRKILSYLETLSPSQSTNFNSPQYRLYNVLYLRYVEGLTVQQTSNELGISTRQAYRDLQKGKDDIVQLFWEDIQKSQESSEQVQPSRITLNPEMSTINLSIQQFNLINVLQESLKKVEPLAIKRNIQLLYTPPSTSININSDLAIAQQIFINIISKSLQKIENESLILSLFDSTPHKILQLSFNYPFDEEIIIDNTTQTLVEKLGWKIIESKEDSILTINLEIITESAVILVIDDNEGIIDLFKRYLAGYSFEVMGCTNSQEGIERAQTLKPILIFLDVMMPYVDGWEILQKLQIDKNTQTIPVVICSVFNDPGLAFSLGAAGVISKPVRKDDITAVLHDLGIA